MKNNFTIREYYDIDTDTLVFIQMPYTVPVEGAVHEACHRVIINNKLFLIVYDKIRVVFVDNDYFVRGIL